MVFNSVEGMMKERDYFIGGDGDQLGRGHKNIKKKILTHGHIAHSAERRGEDNPHREQHTHINTEGGAAPSLNLSPSP